MIPVSWTRRQPFPKWKRFNELPIEELLGEHAAARLQALHVHHPALDGVVLHHLRGPLAELNRALVLDLEADGDDGLQVVVLDVVGLSVGRSC